MGNRKDDVKVHYTAMIRCVVLLALFALPLATAGSAGAKSRWVETFESRARLVAAKKHKIGGRSVLMAGIQVKLNRGWKTYWRNPGDAGLPPSFDWSGSANLKSARVLWPAPERIADPFGSSIGYHNEIVFPVAVEPKEQGRPIDLKLGLGFAVCKDICAPAAAKLTLRLEPAGAAGAAHDALVSQYLKQVPVPLKPGLAGPSITAVEIKLSPPKPHITVDAAFPGDAKEGDLFVDGPEGVFVPMTRRGRETPDGQVRFMVDLAKGDDPQKLKGKTLTFTLVSPRGNREMTRAVD
jgi:DsbC/DsbD-like thiol-disulfide interchange protein